MESVHYNLVGRAPVVISVFLSFMVFTAITTALRVYVKISTIKTFGYDDWTSVAGWVLFIAYDALIIAGCYHGLGQYTDKVSPSDLPIALKLWWTAELFNILCFATVKTSIALQLLHYVVEPFQKRFVLCVTGLILLYSIALFFLYIFQCTPPSFYWTQLEGDTAGTCINFEIIKNTGYAYTSLTLLVDLTMAILPWLMVRKMQLKLRTRVMVSIILGCGSIAFVATVVRIPYLRTLADPAAFLYNASNVWIWSCAEVGLSLSASSAITLRPLIKRFKSKSDQPAISLGNPRVIHQRDSRSGGDATRMTGSTLVCSSAGSCQLLGEKHATCMSGYDFPKVLRIGTTLSDI